MADSVDYEAFEEQYRRPVMSMFERRSATLWELISTVVVLGLVLNILANVIWTMFDPVASLDVLYYKVTVAIGAILTLLMLGLYLVRLRFKDMSVIESPFRAVIIWDSARGEIPSLGYSVFYNPQTDVEVLLESEELREIAHRILACRDIPHDEELRVARHLFERVLFLILGSWRGPTSIPITNTSYFEILNDSNPFVSNLQSSQAALSFPGYYRAIYNSTENQGGELMVRWENGFRGELCISFGTQTRKPIYSPAKGKRKHPSMLSGMVLVDALSPEIDPHSLIRGTFNVRLHAKFSPFDLSLNLNHSRNLYSWVKFLFDDLRHFMDWDYTRFRASRAAFSGFRPPD